MPVTTPTDSSAYPPISRALHWLGALCVLVAFAAVLAREAIDADAPRAVLMAVHRQAGLTALVLLAARLVARLVSRARWPEPAEDSPWLRRAAAGAHGLLYVALLVLPLLGWSLTNAHGHPLALWGLLRLPTLVATDPDRADDLEDWHGDLAWALAVLVALHVGAALWHHFVRRDGVLRRMWPARAPYSSTTTETGR
ncbi:MAG: cytochrome b [Rubrivivax sp.]